MKKLLLIGSVALSVLSASAAHATEYQGNLPKPVQKLLIRLSYVLLRIGRSNGVKIDKHHCRDLIHYEHSPSIHQQRQRQCFIMNRVVIIGSIGIVSRK